MKAKDLKKLAAKSKQSSNPEQKKKSKKNPPEQSFLDNRPEAIQQVQLKQLSEDNGIIQKALEYQDTADSSDLTVTELLKQESYFSSDKKDQEISDKKSIEVRQLIEQVYNERDFYGINEISKNLNLVMLNQVKLNTLLGPKGRPARVMDENPGHLLLKLNDAVFIRNAIINGADAPSLSTNVTQIHKKLSPLGEKLSTCLKNFKETNNSYILNGGPYDQIEQDLNRLISNSKLVHNHLMKFSFSHPDRQRVLKQLQSELLKFQLWLQEIKAEITGKSVSKKYARKLSAKNSKR
ncbi:MAG: hypothetical protein AAF502_15950 [Bacteroidota bacterium]